MDLAVPPSMCEKATKLFAAGAIRPALKLLTHELERRPDQGELWQLLATILHSEANWKEALAAIENASALIPLSLAGQLVLADCYSFTDKHDLALVAYRHLLEQETLPVEYYASMYVGFKRAGKFEQAMACCRKAVEIAPENDEAYFAMAHCMSTLAFAPRQVTAVLQKAVELAPDKPNYRISLVTQLALTKRRQEAYEVLTQGAPDVIGTVHCVCVVRQLLTLCAWAGDEQRCSELGVLLARLSRHDG